MNPYEIRLDIVKLAQSISDREQEADMKAYEAQLAAMVTGGFQPDYIRQYAVTNKPVSANTETLIQNATALYKFVSDTRSSSVNKTTSDNEQPSRRTK